MEDPNEDFFGSLFESQKRRKTSVAKMVELYLRDPPNKDILAALSVCKNLKNVFKKLNTPLPSSAAVERLFSLGKDVLRPKRASLSDEQARSQKFAMGGAVWGVWGRSPQPPEANGVWGRSPQLPEAGGLGAKPPAAGGTGVWVQSPQRSKILHVFAKITSF